VRDTTTRTGTAGGSARPVVGRGAPVLEMAVLQVRPGAAADFESAFREAQRFLAESAGYRGHELRRCLETADRYLLLVGWDSVESHTEGFRGSARYAQWRALLHDFYEPFPVVEHYEVLETTVG